MRDGGGSRDGKRSQICFRGVAFYWIWRLREKVLKITPRLMAWTSDGMIVPPNEKSHVGRIAGESENV